MVREANRTQPPLFGPMNYPQSAPGYQPQHPPHPGYAYGQRGAQASRVIYCTQCGSPMQVPAGAVGLQYACPKCRTVLEVPA